MLKGQSETSLIERIYDRFGKKMKTKYIETIHGRIEKVLEYHMGKYYIDRFTSVQMVDATLVRQEWDEEDDEVC